MPIASLLEQAAFNADTTRILATAFDETWKRVKASPSPLGEEDNEAAARLLLAKWIIAKAHSGERDVNRLVENGLAFLANLKLPLPPSAGETPRR